MHSTSSYMGVGTSGLERDVQLRVRPKLPSLAMVMPALLVLASFGCDDWIKEWREERAASRKEEADKAKPDYIPPECRHQYGLYRVFSSIFWNYDRCSLAVPFSNDSVVWWGGTDTYGPDHKATRVRKQGCVYEYAEDHFVGTETREWTKATGPGKKGKPKITYEGTWTVQVPAWRTTCVAYGWEVFIKESDP